ncbi:ABC transporter ATP-binding protein [Microbaculum marinisediminis]|uniref:ABC transporter ATP-binding protein n=1 Tax=Microbaculum marinisediminis TaxID=2931392 RepID=A0AAW5QX50_9HYPH|nr:ABC transporter ATP-binding protein [Microbaculum sp. A6E488]MCT8971560.1 ABC transporter ATP-binding protein [Microbaculum sp. A6E488]
MPDLKAHIRQAKPIPLDADLSCAPGEVLALVGPSGSGKSTILRVIAGLYRPDEGRVGVGEETWLDTAAGTALPAYRRTVGFVFQSYALFPHMTAQANVEAALDHVGTERRSARARELLTLVHLDGLEGRRPAELSGGQQQRVAVARALARDPKVLLLDEPFSAVDRATRKRLYREIAELRRSLDVPVILVTHDLDEAVMLADRIAVLHRGRILQTGTPQEITTRPASPEVARLVDLRNVFEATILEGGESGCVLDWAGHRLEIPAQRRFAAGARVAWVIPDGFVVLHRRDRPSRGERENPVSGLVDTVLAIGQTVHVTMRIDGPEDLPLHFSVPAHVARRNSVDAGTAITVSLLAEGIHLMPRSEDPSPAGERL